MSTIRKFSSFLFSSFERDLSRSIGKEVASMEEFMFLAPQAFSYQKTPGISTGAFSRTAVAQECPSKLVRVDLPVKSRGLFHE